MRLKDCAHEVYEHLVYLAEGGAPSCSEYGLCHEIRTIFNDSDAVVAELMELVEGWPMFSGDVSFPVHREWIGERDEGYGSAAEAAYYEEKDLWGTPGNMNEYQTLRRGMCAYLAKVIEEEYM